MELISCKKAIELGLPRYFTGKPCKRGHVAERRVIGRCCVICANDIVTTWAKKNPERVKEISTNWNRNNKEKEAARAREWRKNNRATYKRMVAEWREKNKLKYKAYMAMATNARRTAKMQRTPSWLTEDEMFLISEAYELAALRTHLLGFQWHVDHIVPLRGKEVSGLHVPWNLQVIPGVENQRKSNRF